MTRESIPNSFCFEDGHRVDSVISATMSCFQSITKRYLLFHLVFISIAIAALVLFTLFFPFLADSFLLAVAIACFFFACVMYFVLRLYFQDQKPRQFITLKDECLKACKQTIPSQNLQEYHLSVARAAEQASLSLNNKELSLYKPVRGFGFLQTPFERFSRIFHWRDVHMMRELFLLASINEYTEVIKNHPTSFDSHAVMACAYINLANHYRAPLSQKHSTSVMQEMKQKFRQSAKRAVEELTILKEYAPNDPWVHTQLAVNFRELKMPEKEIEQYETCVRLCPSDADMLFTLGTLYFKQGLNAKGLKVYEQLKAINFEKAEALIDHYGAFHSLDSYTSVSS